VCTGSREEITSRRAANVGVLTALVRLSANAPTDRPNASTSTPELPDEPLSCSAVAG
jgi:hypothetical protein